jgi:hypothetical protein
MRLPGAGRAADFDRSAPISAAEGAKGRKNHALINKCAE